MDEASRQQSGVLMWGSLSVHGCVLIRQQLFRHTRGRTWAGEDGKNPLSFPLAHAGMDRAPMRETHSLSTFSMVRIIWEERQLLF